MQRQNGIEGVNSPGDNSPGDSSTPSQHNQMNQNTSKSIVNTGIKSNSMRAGVKIDIFSSNPTFLYSTHDSDRESL